MRATLQAPARRASAPAPTTSPAPTRTRLTSAATLAWLDRVRHAIGARPILYTYPSFWDALGGTSSFRLHPLWIANYEVSEPHLPGAWRRYAIWQYTASGT